MRKRNNIYKIIILIIIVGVLLYYFIGTNHRQDSLKDENVNFTIAEIKDVEYGARVAPWFNFQFYADDNEIIEGKYDLSKNKQLSVQDYDSLKKYIGKKYIVKYSKKYPAFNEIYLQKLVPDSLYDCIGCKWDKMPY